METSSIVILLIIIISVAYFVDKKSKNRKTIHEAKKTKDATLFLKLPLFQGLAVPQNTLCDIFSCPTYYEFKLSNTTFKLDKNKVQDVSLKTDKEIQKYYTSSVGGAIGGAVLLGPLGAMIGGRTKKKIDTTVKTYLIFTYLKDNTVQYISFDATTSLAAHKFVNEFKKSNSETNATIEL